MAVGLSVKASSLLKETGIKPQIILDIEGLDLIFGAQPVFKTLTWDDESDDARFDSGLFWDGSIKDSKARDYISLDGTTTNITQQIAPDKGSTSSISTVNITIVDKNGEVSRALSFDNFTEILGRKAVFAIGFSQGSYPEDTQPVFRGVIVDFYTEAGAVMISMASAESLKRQVLLDKIQTELTTPINDTDTIIELSSTDGIVGAGDALKTYLRADDELIEIVSIDSETQVTGTRGQLNTIAQSHNGGVETFYRLQGKPLELALKLMLSNDGNEFFTSLDTPKSINFVSVTESIDNALIFDYYDIQEKTGLTVNDKIKLDSTLNTGEYTIDEFGVLDNGSYIKVKETLVTESEYADNFQYNSKWNILPIGLGMLTNEVDVAGFESIINSFGANFVDMDIYIKDTIENCKDFIDRELFYVQGLYAIPRKARASVKFVAPPFSSEIVPTLNVDAITNPTMLKQRRSTHKYFYNTYTWRFNQDSIEDKFLNGKIIVSGDSVTRINVGKKQLKIDALGLRNNAGTINMINNISQRLIDRYQFAPVYYSDVEVKYKDGYTLEVGDIVPFGGAGLQVTNLQTGERGAPLELFEIINKSLNVKNGKIKLSLASTSFEIDARYAVISLASFTGTGSTTTNIKIVQTLDTDEFARESDKWIDFVGQQIRVRSKDYVNDEVVTLKEISPIDNAVLIVEPALSFVPGENYVIEPPVYDDTSQEANDIYKIQFGHKTFQAEIDVVTDESNFTVIDPSGLKEGSQIYVHSPDYSRDSFGQSVQIDSIIGNNVTLNKPLDFLPVSGDKLENSKFLDDGNPYNLL